MLSVVIKGKIAQLSFKGKTTTTISTWTNFFDSDLTEWIKANASPLSFVNCNVRDGYGINYFFKFVDEPYFWNIGEIASGTELFFNCTWIIK